MCLQTAKTSALILKQASFQLNQSWRVCPSFLAGVPAGSQRHHPQFAPGSSAVVGHHAQTGSASWTQDSHMRGPKIVRRKLQSDGTEAQVVAGLKSCLQRLTHYLHLNRRHCCDFLTNTTPSNGCQAVADQKQILVCLLVFKRISFIKNI